ncbi:MAG: L,D-transpeptidase family protein [Candidatus Omnitrophica bacterium]|nr:L,D-transpeptidase family protein [Candidatus Omnitrophota bacterium]
MNQKILIGILVAILLAALTFVALRHHNASASLKDSPETALPVNQLLQEAAQYETQGDKLKAKEAYAQIVSNYPDYEKIEEIQQKLGELNIALIVSPTPMPQTIYYEIKPGDSLGKLSRKYNTTGQLIKKANGLKSDVIRTGERLRIWTAPFNLLVNKSQNVLFLKSGEEVLKIYHVSTGKDNITPVGTFKIASKIEKPVWFKAGGMPIPSESPENELGSRWMGFDVDPHYGIHGTLHPESIGQQVTAGCVRLKNQDVEELFDILPIGTQVVIQN